MKRKLLILGAGGHGKVVADIALKMDKWDEISFLDDNNKIKTSMGLKVIGTSEDVYSLINSYQIFIAFGDNDARQKKYEILETFGADIPVLIHPNAIIGSNVDIASGTVIMAGAIVNCCTRIGKGCIINTGCTIDHDNSIENFVHISPGVHLAGNVNIGKGTWLGIGSIVCNSVNIFERCKIGAGAVVIKDITEIGTYVGVPVKKLN